MKITILTLFPEMFDSFKNTSIIKRAIENNKAEIECVNIRDYTKDKHHKVDDTPYGGGAGMLMQLQPVLDCLNAVKTDDSYVVLMAPIGKIFKQAMASKMVKKDHIIIVCGHYEGIDARFYKYVNEIISIGDYILTGGEVAAMVVSDAIIRLTEGVIFEESHQDESFENGLLEYPQYTKPADYQGDLVPGVLISGHHENIRKFRLIESLKLTKENRPDLLENREFSEEELEILATLK